jgi:hypothetical protein
MDVELIEHRHFARFAAELHRETVSIDTPAAIGAALCCAFRCGAGARARAGPGKRRFVHDASLMDVDGVNMACMHIR